jgi:DNA-directed RNA polymerase subunit M/transcription elongation factor TFIIS
MRFCEICRNMMYMSCNDGKTLMFFCKTCNNSVPHVGGKESLSVDTVDFSKDDTMLMPFMTTDIKLDPTLPRVDNIACNNTECVGPASVTYIKYDKRNMKFLYYCHTCESRWKSDNQKRV